MTKTPTALTGDRAPTTFAVIRDGWVAGRFARAGERVLMSPRDAQYEPLLGPMPRTKKAGRTPAAATGGDEAS